MEGVLVNSDMIALGLIRSSDSIASCLATERFANVTTEVSFKEGCERERQSRPTRILTGLSHVQETHLSGQQKQLKCLWGRANRNTLFISSGCLSATNFRALFPRLSQAKQRQGFLDFKDRKYYPL